MPVWGWTFKRAGQFLFALKNRSTCKKPWDHYAVKKPNLSQPQGVKRHVEEHWGTVTWVKLSQIFQPSLATSWMQLTLCGSDKMSIRVLPEFLAHRIMRNNKSVFSATKLWSGLLCSIKNGSNTSYEPDIMPDTSHRLFSLILLRSSIISCSVQMRKWKFRCVPHHRQRQWMVWEVCLTPESMLLATKPYCLQRGWIQPRHSISTKRCWESNTNSHAHSSPITSFLGKPWDMLDQSWLLWLEGSKKEE